MLRSRHILEQNEAPASRVEDGMKDTLASPSRSLVLGLLISLALLAFWVVSASVDRIGFVSFLLRWLHIASAMIWVGMIWFVNFIQLVAVAEAEPPARAAILKHIVPRVALTFRHASHVAIGSGVLLLATSGYLLDQLVFSAPVYVPLQRSLLIWAGVVAAMAMYMFVHMMIWPGLRKVLGIEAADVDQIAAARVKVATYARWNLVLAVPVTVAMVAAAHLY